MAQRRKGLILAGVFLPLFTIGAYRWAAQSSVRAFAHSSRREQTAPQPPPQTDAAPAPPERARIRVDTGRTFDGPASDAATICRVGQSEPMERILADLGGARLEADSSVEQVPVYAARLENGVALLVANRADARASFDIVVRLSRGVYTAERTTAVSTDQTVEVHTERLEPVVLGGVGTLTKPGWLGVGEMALYRFVNRSAQTASAFKSVKDRVRAVRGGRSSEYRRLMGPLGECESHVGALSGGIRPSDRSESLKHIHRALLTVAHAQSLCRNARGMGRLSEAQAEGLGQALDRLEASLTELSAGCLALVPVVSVAPEHDGSSEVTVSLLNAGQQTVGIVKLGVTPPSGVTVRPADEALFRSVQPGQTVRAAFTVRFGDQAADRAVTADFSYIAARVPAHLRLRAEVASQAAGDSGRPAPSGTPSQLPAAGF